TMKYAFIIGLAQAIALIQGVSRSAASIVAAMGVGVKQQTALLFSYLMFIPVSLGGAILIFSYILSDPHFNEIIILYSMAFICTFIATYFSLKWFMGIMERGNLKYFSYYCFIVGTVVLIFL